MTELDQDQVDELSLARNSAARMLAGREHSQVELHRKLKQKGYTQASIETVIFEFAEANLQSDERFAQSLVRSCYNKGKGPNFIMQTLQQHQIELSGFQDVINDPEWDWFDLAAKVREKRFGELMPEDFNEIQKQKRFLQYRGFMSEHIKEVFQN